MSRRLELKDFIKRARKTHRNKYSYASVQYQNIDSKVKIKCPTHGYFDQIAWNHIGRPRSGCPKCGDLRTAAKRRSKNASAFISEARKVHGNRYDYSKAIYRSINKPVCVICTKHGEFWPTPHNHINLRCRCFKCAKKEIANELILRFGNKFKQRAREVHGKRYNYKQADYKGATTPIKIKCNKHGFFKQTPQVHLVGGGCQECGTDRLREVFALTHEEFLRRARKLHANKYEYLERYKNSVSPIKIRCAKHGVFKQAPISHLKATGCPACSYRRTGLLNRLTHQEFLKKVEKVHPAYSFPDDYITAIKKIKTRCPKHGIFLMTPNALLNGHGCQRCDDERTADRIRLTHKEFLQRCRRVHAEKYIYPEEYRGGKIKIKIECPKHGPFFQVPSGHLMGSGCPACFESSGERVVSRALESLKVGYVRQKKFPDLVHKRQLRFDFWLPSFKSLVEFDGVQHFQASSFFGGLKAFEQTRLRDRIKNTWAKKMRFPLIRIPYTHPMPEEILRKKLKI